MPSYTPVQTKLGTLRGRDAIYLDRVVYVARKLVLEGEVNGKLCDDTAMHDKWVGYRLAFHSAEAFNARDLEVHERWLARSGVKPMSSFDEVEDSPWLETLDLSATYRHFVVSTYDTVIDVSANGFEFEITRLRAAK